MMIRVSLDTLKTDELVDTVAKPSKADEFPCGMHKCNILSFGCGEGDKGLVFVNQAADSLKVGFACPDSNGAID